jgi:hypothetical protein
MTISAWMRRIVRQYKKRIRATERLQKATYAHELEVAKERKLLRDFQNWDKST